MDTSVLHMPYVAKYTFCDIVNVGAYVPLSFFFAFRTTSDFLA